MKTDGSYSRCFFHLCLVYLPTMLLAIQIAAAQIDLSYSAALTAKYTTLKTAETLPDWNWPQSIDTVYMGTSYPSNPLEDS